MPVRISHHGIQRQFIFPDSHTFTIPQAQTLIKSAFALQEDCVGLYEPQSQMVFPFSLLVSSPSAFTEEYTLVLSNSGIQYPMEPLYKQQQHLNKKRMKRPHSVSSVDGDREEYDLQEPDSTSSISSFNFSPHAVASGKNDRFPQRAFQRVFPSTSPQRRPVTARGRNQRKQNSMDLNSALSSARSNYEPLFSSALSSARSNQPSTARSNEPSTSRPFTSSSFTSSFADFQPYTSRSKEEAFTTLFSKPKQNDEGKDFVIEYSDDEYSDDMKEEKQKSPSIKRSDLTELEQLQRRAGFTTLRPSELLSIFKRSSHNGFMDRPTFEIAFTRFIPLSSLRSEEERREFKQTLNRLFDLFDRNHDGQVDFREFSAGLLLLCQGDTDEKIALAFSLYDQDDDGFIAFDELCSYFQSFFTVCLSLSKNLHSQLQYVSPATLGEATAIQCFQEVDTDRDGLISFDDFVDWYSQPANAHLHETQLTGLEIPDNDHKEWNQEEQDRREVAQVVRQLSRHRLDDRTNDESEESDNENDISFDANELYITDVADGADDDEPSEYDDNESYHRATYEQWLRNRKLEKAQAQAQARKSTKSSANAPAYPRSNEALGLRPQTRRPVPEPRHLSTPVGSATTPFTFTSTSTSTSTRDPVRHIPIRNAIRGNTTRSSL